MNNPFGELWRRIQFLFRRGQFDRDLEEEVRLHLEHRAKEQAENNDSSEEEARYAARRQFGNTTQIKETSRELWGWRWFETLVQDVRYALRQLRKSPGFTAVAVLSLALGIGANTAIFSVVNAVLLRLLPVRDPQQLVLVGVARPEKALPSFGMPYPAYEHFRDHNQVFSSFSTYGWTSCTITLDDVTEHVNSQLISGLYFETLGVKAALGRIISAEDDLPSSSPITVISYAYWQSHFGSTPHVIGKAITLNRVPFTIIGVTPPGFFGLELGNTPQLYVPITSLLRLEPADYRLRSGTTWWVRMIGRLRPGVSEKQAQANLNQLFPSFLRAAVAEAPPNVPQVMKNSFLRQTIVVAPGSQGLSNLRRQFSRPLLVLMAVVALVLLIACANIANLLLSRTVARRRELAVRAALGASRVRVMRQLFTESLLLAALGGVAGFFAAQWGKRLLLVLTSKEVGSLDLSNDAHILWFTTGISLLAAIFFGLAPAFRATRVDVASTLKENHRKPGFGLPRLLLGKLLVISQVALSLLLLIGAGLFLRSLQNLRSVDAGFARSQVLLFSIDPTLSGYSGSRLLSFYDDLAQRLKTLPGVLHVSFSQYSPISGSDNTTMISEFGVPAAVHITNSSHRNVVYPGFFDTLGIRLLAGRDFTPQDNETAPKVAIVNETFARDHFGVESPIGKRLGYAPGQRSGPVTIVGITRDSKFYSLRDQNTRMVYLPYWQYPTVRGMTFELRVASDLASLSRSIRKEIGKEIAINGLTTLNEQVNQSLMQERLVATLTSFFGLLALLLASIGLYGVMNYMVTRRTNEIGIRMALGAKPHQVLLQTLSETFILILIGVAIGVPIALVLTRFVSSLLFGLTPTDPLTISIVTFILLVVTVVAAYLPARRASRIDPMVALRYE